MKQFSRTRWLFTIILINLFLSSACSPHSLPSMPDLGIPVEEFNTHFKLTTSAGMNTFKIDEPIWLYIDVIGEETVAFDFDEYNQDRELSLFILQNQQWVPVENLTQYPEGYLVYGPAEGDPLKRGVITVFPILENQNQEALIRVVVTGKIFKDEQITDEKVVGYVDVQLKP